MRRLLLLTSALLLLGASTATAATVTVVRGAGFGHGIGMSQYGAYGYAQHGYTYKQILAHYYTGTALGSAANRRVRVLLQASDPYVRIKGLTVGPGGRALKPGKSYKITYAGGRLKINGVGKFSSPLRVHGGTRGVRLMGRALNGLSSGRYRGTMELRAGAGGGVTAINDLPVDSYTRGVVAAEMPSTWSIEALKSQAVAARTYALATDKPGVFDQYPDTRSQVYRGISAETARSNAAVRATARQIVTYNGEIATTFFFSTSGGQTENVEDSFIGSAPEPWLKSVKDPYDNISPKHRWTARFTNAQLDAKLSAPGKYKKIRVIARGQSPRIVRARVYGSGGTRTLTGPQVRSRLGLYDTWAYFTKVSSARAKRSGARASGFPTFEIAGSFEPAPRGRRLIVDRRSGGKWKHVSGVATSRSGRYRATVGVAGTYRVRWGSVAGPAVRVG